MITLDIAVATAKEVVAGKEDYIYINPDGVVASEQGKGIRCYNWNIDTDEPSCIVGHILYRLHVPKGLLIRYNTKGVQTFARYLSPLIGTGIEVSAMHFLAGLQLRQDAGKTWGQSLEGALRAAGIQ